MTLTDSPTSLVRSLKGAPLACLFILLLSGEARRAGALCQATGYSPNSITAALRLLSDQRLIEKTPDGWRVPAHQRSALLSLADSQVEFANRDSIASFREFPPSGGVVINSESSLESPPPPDRLSQIAPLPDTPQISAAETANCFPTWSSVTSRDALEGHPLIPRILDATRLLFGERLHGPPSRYPDVRLLLAAIAEAYVRRESLRKPARVAYANLKRGVDPGSEFLADPLAYLPAVFLAEIGLPQPSGTELPDPDSGGAEAGDDAPAAPNTLTDPLPGAHPSLALPADVHGRRSAAQVWQVVWETLRYELSRPVFETYLAGCSLASFDPADAVFNVAVPDEQSCLWLQDRLSVQLSRLLTGICDRPCYVRFEVSP